MPAVATATASVKTVRYRAYAVRVPASWPVFRLASDRSACVRFNRHAVYLGRPGSAQRCPPQAIGRTEAILVEPLTASAARAGAGAAPALRAPRTAMAGTSEAQLTLPARGVIVTATWARSPATIRRALGVRSLPREPALRPAAATAGTTALSHQPRATRAPSHQTRASVVHPVNLGGFGFDACSAPSATDMTAWLESSPFRAAGIYIGGVNSACTQTNLTASWVAAESAAGWQFIPTYVGLQAPHGCCQAMSSVPAQASAEGTAAAADAVVQAQALGIDSGNPIYDDMEAYTPTPSTTAAVLAFLSAWTTELHAYGYLSGVYSSGSSGITDMVDALGTTVVEPDDLWIADWNDQATASDPYVPAGDWPNNQRLRQYRGDHTDSYGGVKLDVDTDYLDGATATAGIGTLGPTALPDGTFVSYNGRTYRLAGGAPLYVHSWSPFGGAQPTIALTTAQWQALKPLPADGTFIRATATGKVYRIAGGAPVYVPSWSAFGEPQPTVTIDRWDIQHITSSLTHLRAVPADGTIVQGLPSGQYWQFNAVGMRVATVPSSTAVIVDDVGLGTYLESPTASRVTLWGISKRKPKLRVTVTAGANAPALKSFSFVLPAGLTFSSRAASLLSGLGVWNRNDRALRSTFSLRRNVLTVTLAASAREVRLAVQSPGLSAGRALVAGVTTRVVTSLQVVVLATDIKHHTAVLTLDPGVSLR